MEVLLLWNKKNSEILNIIEFDMINNSEVNISNNGIKKVLSIKKGKIAFDSFGEMSSFSNLNLISNKN